MFVRVLLLCIFAVVAGCGGGSTASSVNSPISDPMAPTALPLLPAGAHLGMIQGFETLPAPIEAAAQARWQEARSHRLKIARVQIAWSDLEVGIEQYDLGPLTRALADVRARGLVAFLTLETIDSEGFVLPADLMDPNNARRLAGGMVFNNPKVLSRFAKLLDRVVPILTTERVWAMAVGNEPDNQLDDLGDATPAGLAYISSVAEFLRAAREHVHKLAPNLAVTMTLRQMSVEQRKPYVSALLAQGDIASFNYYCQDAQFKVQDASVVRKEIADMIAAAAPRQVVLQELGCPAGPTNQTSRIRANLNSQAAFFSAVGAALASEPKLRAAFAFQLVDWSPALSKLITDPLRTEGFPDLANDYDETLQTLGLIRYADGMPRPAWRSFVDTLDRLYPQ